MTSLSLGSRDFTNVWVLAVVFVPLCMIGWRMSFLINSFTVPAECLETGQIRTDLLGERTGKPRVVKDGTSHLSQLIWKLDRERNRNTAIGLNVQGCITGWSLMNCKRALMSNSNFASGGDRLWRPVSAYKSRSP
jgi:hypothetical protein